MEEKESNFIVRAIHNFQSDEPGELSLSIGDIVQVIKKVDRYWFRGYSNGKEGNFPSAFAVEVELKDNIEPEWKLFAALSPFTEQESNDLGFDKGELLIGYQAANTQWWQGKRAGDDSKEGIFPLTHVWELDKRYLPKSDPIIVSPGSVQYGVVDYDLKPEIPEEIPLCKGDRVKIFGNHDRMYYKGECNGVVGIFPKRFVTLIQEDSRTTQNSNFPPNSTPSSTNHTYENEIHSNLHFAPSISISRSSTPLVTENSGDLPPSYEESVRSGDSSRRNISSDGIQSYAKVIHPFTAQRDDELSLTPGEIVHLVQYVDREENWILGEVDGRVGLFPSNFVKIIVDVTDRSKKAQSLVETEYPPDTYARVLYTFNAEFEGEISVKEGDIVTLLRSFNNDWVEATDDRGNEGIIPLNHVEVIGGLVQPSSSSSHNLEPSSLGHHQVNVNNLMEFSPDEPDHHASSIQNIPSLENLSISKPRQSPILETVIEEAEARSNLHGSLSSIAPARPAPPSLQRHPSSSSSIRSISPSPTPSPRTSSLGLSLTASPQIPVRTTSALNNRPIIPSSIASNLPTQSTETVAYPTINDNQSTSEEDRIEARRKKMMEQRSCIIMEMLQSERDYCSDLRFCAKIFLHDEKMTTQLTEKGVVLESIFCNLEDIIIVSEKLTRSLEESCLCRKPENQMIGRCFLNLEEEIKQAYIIYCRDHEDVPVFWKKYEENPEVKVILQKGLDRIKAGTNCFDVPSLLIKPVQRILKYPLLLNELLKCTDESHPDREDIIKAANMITDMAQDINELKRRKDLVFKYRKTNANSSFSSKISKLNMHTVKKKSSRFGYRLTTTFGLAASTKDEKFEEEANKFKVMEKTIKIFLKDLNLFIDSMQEFVNSCFALSECIASFYAERCTQPDVEAFRTIQRLIKVELWEEMKKSIETRVINILKLLLTKFVNPSKLIEKRQDKLLDYDAATKKVESNKDTSRAKFLKDEQTMAKNNYEALHRQLLDELPLFTARTVEVIQGCVSATIKIKKIFLAKVTEEMMKLLSLPALLGSLDPLSPTSVLETFQVKYNLIVDQMIADFNMVSASIFPNASVAGHSGATEHRRGSKDARKIKATSVSGQSLKKSVSSGQSKTDRIYLENTYKGHLYKINRDYETTDLAGLTVRKDDIVGIIKYKDPSGNCHIWFVDNGAEKGFLPENILSPLPGTIGPGASFDKPPSTGLTEIPLTPSSYHYQNNPSVSNSNNSVSQSFSTNNVLPPPLAPINPVHRSNSSCSTSSSISMGSSGKPGVIRPAPKPPSHPASIQRAESFTVKQQAPPPPLPARSTSIDSGSRYDHVSDNTVSSGFYQNLLTDVELNPNSNRYSNIDEFDPLAQAASTTNQLNENRYEDIKVIEHRYEDIDGPERYENLDATSGAIQNNQIERKPVNETWKAAYQFNPQGPYQVQLKKSTQVLVLHKSDLNGNSEWWFVRNHEGQEGYVPANYLAAL